MTRITKRRPLLRFSLPRWIRPKALAHAPAEPLVALLLLAGLGSVFVVDQITPRTVSVGSFAALFVVLAAWLLSARATVAVTAIAVVLQGWLGLDSALSSVSAGSNIAVILLMAWVGHLAAANSAESRALRERQLRILLELANRLNLAADLQGALDDVAAVAARFVAPGGRRPAERGTVWTLGARGLEVAAESDGPGVRLRGRRFEPAARLREILSGRAPGALRVNALGDEMGAALAEAGVESMAVAPIPVGGEPFGMLTASGRDSRPFTATELELLGGLAQVAGLAIARTRETDLARRRIQVLEVLNEVMLAAGSAGSVDEVSGLVAEKVRALLGAQTGVLVLHDPHRGGFWVEAATRPLNLVAAEPGQGVLGAALSGATAAVVDGRPPWQQPADAEVAADAAHLLAAPIRARGEVLGALVAAGAGFGEHEELLLALLGAQLGPVLDAMRCLGSGDRRQLGGRRADGAAAGQPGQRRHLRPRLGDGVGGGGDLAGLDAPAGLRPPLRPTAAGAGGQGPGAGRGRPLAAHRLDRLQAAGPPQVGGHHLLRGGAAGARRPGRGASPPGPAGFLRHGPSSLCNVCRL